MRILNEYYKKSLKSLVVLILLSSYFIVNVANKISVKFTGLQSLTSAIIAFASSSTFATIIFLVGELVIRKHLWKYRWFLSKYDYSGEWYGLTHYSDVEIDFPPHSGQKPFKPFFTEHKLVIEQDCNYINILPSEGADFHWNSTSINLTDDGSLKYSYEVTYTNKNNFNNKKTIGYEALEVLKRDTKTKKPTLMKGVFYHCAMGQKPVYRGDIVFSRTAFTENTTDDRLIKQYLKSQKRRTS